MNTNPFTVAPPESLSASEIASLFIDVFSDFPRLLQNEHTFLHGPRGSGKSMMLRYLEPQVQVAANKVEAANMLPHFAIHMPIKRGGIWVSELLRLKGAAYDLLSEHLLILAAVDSIFESLQTVLTENESNTQNLCALLEKVTQQAINCGSKVEPTGDNPTWEKLWDALNGIMESETFNAKKYLENLSFTDELRPFKGALFNYDNFLMPLIGFIRSMPCTPNGPVFLMIDDADNLSVRMQQILNGWVSCRSTETLCLKISTQQRYKTWRTIQGILIESPHDFSEIDISRVYTSQTQSDYFNKVKTIIAKRLELTNCTTTDPEQFFPYDHKQLQAKGKIRDEIKERWKKGDGVSSRASDDVTRYTTSEYMKKLAKNKKTNTYSYAGFKSLVDLSSGMIRNFLEPAAIMYTEAQKSLNTDTSVREIPVPIQNKTIYKWSEEFVVVGLSREEQESATKVETNSESKDLALPPPGSLKNLVNAIGETFQAKLLSDGAERRYLSFMPTKQGGEELEKVLQSAVEWGYLQRSTIARKEGVGRNVIYIINRRLAPYFKLDPAGYAAHMSVTPHDLELAIHEPAKFVLEKSKPKALDDSQATLF